MPSVNINHLVIAVQQCHKLLYKKIQVVNGRKQIQSDMPHHQKPQ